MEKESVLKKKIIRMPRKGELVIHKKLIVLVTGYGNYNAGYRCFSGVVISPDEDWPLGTYSRTWGCDAFEKINYTINFHPIITVTSK